MDLYDTAHKLSSEIKESKEYKEYKNARAQVIKNPELKKKIEEFEKIRYEEQVLAFEKGNQSPEKMQKLQQMYNMLTQDKQLKAYFDLEVKFNVMIADINKIIAESMLSVFGDTFKKQQGAD